MNLIKKYYRNYSTKGLSKYWLKKETQYWLDYLKTWNHPRRNVIVNLLAQIPFISLMELGCGSGPNLMNLVKRLPGKQIGGIDINPIAIEIAKQNFKGAVFKCCSADNLLVSDKGMDVCLTDMLLIYVGPGKINRYLEEMKRVTRNWVVLVEYHHESWLKRLMLRIKSGRHSYNYRDRLNKLGFHDVTLFKMPKFDEDNDDEFRHIIIAKVPKY